MIAIILTAFVAASTGFLAGLIVGAMLAAGPKDVKELRRTWRQINKDRESRA